VQKYAIRRPAAAESRRGAGSWKTDEEIIVARRKREVYKE
jgi:hypothetical protein